MLQRFFVSDTRTTTGTQRFVDRPRRSAFLDYSKLWHWTISFRISGQEKRQTLKWGTWSKEPREPLLLEKKPYLQKPKINFIDIKKILTISKNVLLTFFCLIDTCLSACLQTGESCQNKTTFNSHSNCFRFFIVHIVCCVDKKKWMKSIMWLIFPHCKKNFKKHK